jgi:hypothetical protein
MGIIEKIIDKIVDAEMARKNVQEEVEAEVQGLRDELYNLDRGVGAYLTRGNVATQRGSYTTTGDLDNEREKMIKARLAEQASYPAKSNE